MAAVKATPKAEVTIKKDWCKGCGICVHYCPKGVLAMSENLKAEVKNPEECTGCGNCEIYCPDFAVSLRRIQ
ncbi:MAG: 4Fe-4S binding protein [Dethiobacteria bacterium]|nr:4Fe-4S binding protein [Bacillota bacterium]